MARSRGAESDRVAGAPHRRRKATISATLRELVDDVRCDLVLTTGGTGPAPRDVTPEATLAVATKVMPGFGEQMRRISLAFVPTAILSRQIAVVRGKALVINLPGQPKSIAETLEGMRAATPPVPGIFAAVPYCIDLIGGPYIETDAAVCAAFRPKSAIGNRRAPEARRGPLHLTSRFSRSASKLSVVCASPGTQSSLGSSREREESFSIACQSSAIWCSWPDALSIRPLHRQRHRIVALRDAIGRKAHLRGRRLARRVGFGLDDARRVADRRRAGGHRLDDDRARADAGAVADREAAEHLRVGADDHALAERRMALRAAR